MLPIKQVKYGIILILICISLMMSEDELDLLGLHFFLMYSKGLFYRN